MCPFRCMSYHFVYVITFFIYVFFFFSSRRRHTRSDRDWSSDVCSSDLIFQSGPGVVAIPEQQARLHALAVADPEGLGGRARDVLLDILEMDVDRGMSDRKSTRLNSSHDQISYAVFCLKKKKNINKHRDHQKREREMYGWTPPTGCHLRKQKRSPFQALHQPGNQPLHSTADNIAPQLQR